MEDSPLTLAHSNAKRASELLGTATAPYSPEILSSAASHHALAATSFASAAKTTKDPESHRCLELLVAEHERWAERLRRQATAPASLESVRETSESREEAEARAASEPREAQEPREAREAREARDSRDSRDSPYSNGNPYSNGSLYSPGSPYSATSSTRSSSRDPKTKPPFAGSVPHYPARLQKASSSLATNLASARGIPPPSRSQPVSPTTSRRRSGSSKPTQNPLSFLPPDPPDVSSPPNGAAVAGTNGVAGGANAAAADDSEASFSKFYSTLNSLIGRIGSPFTASLAFTGLPISSTPTSPSDSVYNDLPETNVLPKNWAGNGGESFYVVPYSGGMMSYASVVGRDREGGERGGGERDQDDRDRDSNGRRDRGSRDRDRRGRTDKDRLGNGGSSGDGRLSIVEEEEAARFQGHNKTLEELQLENSTLRKTIEHMAKDMQIWRKKTEEGLKSSILEIISKDGTGGTSLSRPGSRRGSPNRTTRRLQAMEDDDEDYSEGRRMGDEEAWREMVKEIKDLELKMRDLEDELGGRKQEIEVLRNENDRLNKALRKWQDRWDRLQKRAKEKESRKEGR
ncbi:hypothetical protein FPQ18DRAFT_386672 [Pyronema domesticum]|uniref:Uncharacterized protein n=1 Tax=Pyronema omphalodes (strain CBS 100304) TaxID=1076935 RepID=U4LCL3_PYROM|nr:hypothetical protein FPQ18DRAFT_386672 [Pyronema domesticum]CCX29613.1 Similar to hypothetical protein [Tuber melanosporum Mel28]; acc. no. XP_002840022 [Pyronema omphalodes CBS 100304]